VLCVSGIGFTRAFGDYFSTFVVCKLRDLLKWTSENVVDLKFTINYQVLHWMFYDNFGRKLIM